MRRLNGAAAWCGAAGGRMRPGAGPGSASAEDLAGHSRSKVQRYLMLLREWPLRRPGEDHRAPPGTSNTAIGDSTDTAPRHAANSVCSGTLTGRLERQTVQVNDLHLWATAPRMSA